MDTHTASKNCTLTVSEWGAMPDGSPVHLCCLRNSNGVEARITTYGGIITALMVPDAAGEVADVVLGFDTLAAYLKPHPHFGALVGRYANRIAGGRFSLAGREFQLDCNNGSNNLHGGYEGFDKRVWQYEILNDGNNAALKLSLTSPDGDQGFPGELAVTAVYSLTPDNVLRLQLSARTTAPTVCNLTQHSYFNLDGAEGSSILGHIVQIEADAYLPVDERLIPEGPAAAVAGTPFDFRRAKSLVADIAVPHRQLELGGGYDHNWLINGQPGTLRRMATATGPCSGRTLAIWSDAPGMQLYTGNFLDGTLTGKNGAVYGRRSGFCFEPQTYPDSPNHPDYPTATLLPGDRYHHTIEYRLGC